MTRVLLGRYELGESLGAGGAGRVHRGVDRRLARPVAVKVLDDNRARAADPAGRDRFLREARSAARLDHPHLVTVYDAGEDAGELFLIMELVDGQSLAALIASRAPLPPPEAVSIAGQILDGLAAVHDEGIVHRDVKPANVLVDRSGRVRLTDFGIAKRLDDVEDNLTTAGTVIGTPTYLAPEQARGEAVSAATDVYLVGLVLFEMLTGRRAVDGERDPRLVRSGIPDHVAAAVLRATDPEPKQRFDSARSMLAALTRADATSTLLMPAAVGVPDAAPTMLIRAAGSAAALRTATMPQVVHPAPGRRRRRWWPVWLLAAVAVGLGLVALAEDRPDDPLIPAATVPATSDQPTAPPTSTVAVPITAPPTTQAPADHGRENSGKPKKKKHDQGDEDG